MKLALLTDNAPPVVILAGELGIPREIVRNDDNVVKAFYDVPQHHRPFKVTDYEFFNTRFLQLFNDLTNDIYDDFEGTLALQIEPGATGRSTTDGYRWYCAEFTRARRTVSVNSTSGALWFTFENPYWVYTGLAGPLEVRRPPTNDTAAPTTHLPYEVGTDYELIKQPGTTAGGTIVATYPKATYLASGEGVLIEAPMYTPWPSRIWMRPDVIAGAEVFVFAY